MSIQEAPIHFGMGVKSGEDGFVSPRLTYLEARRKSITATGEEQNSGEISPLQTAELGLKDVGDIGYLDKVNGFIEAFPGLLEDEVIGYLIVSEIRAIALNGIKAYGGKVNPASAA